MIVRAVGGALRLRLALVLGGLFVAACLVVALTLGLTSITSNGSGNGSGDCGTQVTIGTGSGAIRYPMADNTYRISSGYGPRGGAFHHGVDFAAPRGTPIYATADGTVAAAGTASGFGLWIVLDHRAAGGAVYSTVYGHMDSLQLPDGSSVKPGDVVSAGQEIARSGNNGQSTGPHLHFEVWPGGRLSGGRDVDPMGWLQSNAGTTAESSSPAPPPSAGDGEVVLVGAVPPQGTQVFITADAEQRENAATITAVVKGRGLSHYAAVVAVATALQESTLRNIDYGDRDSLGLFQQRPSQGWGSREQILDAVYSTGKFLDGLVRVAGWESLALTDAAQLVQRSGFPLAYAKWQTQAAQLVAESAGIDPITAGIGAQPSACGIV